MGSAAAASTTQCWHQAGCTGVHAAALACAHMPALPSLLLPAHPHVVVGARHARQDAEREVLAGVLAVGLLHKARHILPEKAGLQVKRLAPAVQPLGVVHQQGHRGLRWAGLGGRRWGVWGALGTDSCGCREKRARVTAKSALTRTSASLVPPNGIKGGWAHLNGLPVPPRPPCPPASVLQHYRAQRVVAWAALYGVTPWRVRSLRAQARSLRMSLGACRLKCCTWLHRLPDCNCKECLFVIYNPPHAAPPSLHRDRPPVGSFQLALGQALCLFRL